MPRPFAFGRALGTTGTPQERLVEMLRGVRAWFDTTSLTALLDGALVDHPGCRRLFDGSVRMEHVGFVAPPWSKELLSQAATEAGFALAHRAFPSVLISRELGRLSGRRRLATQIFKAYGHAADTYVPAFEAFIPNTDDDTATEWMRAGVIEHVAVVVPPSQFNEIRSALVAARFPIAGFMYGRAVYLPGEDATMTYFDLGGGDHPYRLEVRTLGDLEDRQDD